LSKREEQLMKRIRDLSALDYPIPRLFVAFAVGLAVVAAPRAGLADGYAEAAKLGDGRPISSGAQPGNSFMIADDSTPPVAPATVAPAASTQSAPLSDRMAQENIFWQSAQQSNTVADYKAYLDAFPNGLYVQLAKNRIAAMAPAPDAGQPSPITPNQSPPGAVEPAAPPAVSPEALKAEIGTVETEQALNLSPQDKMELQQQLSALGLYAGPIDGDLGPGSRAAIAEWQRRHEAEPTGELGPLQLAALRGESEAAAQQRPAVGAPVNGQRIYYGGVCPPGYHPGPYRHRCWRN
jgi:Putative peptidoglycan binding domain